MHISYKNSSKDKGMLIKWVSNRDNFERFLGNLCAIVTKLYLFEKSIEK